MKVSRHLVGFPANAIQITLSANDIKSNIFKKWQGKNDQPRAVSNKNQLLSETGFRTDTSPSRAVIG